jgi:two-component system NtrC family sensor kinase
MPKRSTSSAMGKCLLFLLLFTTTAALAQHAGTDDAPVVLKQLPSKGVLLNKGWKFTSGDNPAYADPAYDDSKWQPIDPTRDIHDLPQLWKGIGWLRLHFTIDSATFQNELSVLVEQTGASEIYMNGHLIQKLGTISNKQREVLAVTPTRGTYISLPVQKHGEQVLAVRFEIQKNIPYILFGSNINYALALRMLDLQKSTGRIFQTNFHLLLDYLRGGLFLILAILHMALFWFNPTQRANLYFCVYALAFAASSFLVSLVYTHVYLTEAKQYLFIAFTICSLFEFLFFLSAIYEIFNRSRGLIFWFLVGSAPISLVGLLDYHSGTFFSLTVFPIVVFAECIRITILAAKEKRRGARILIAGAVLFILLYVLMNLLMFGFLPAGSDQIYQHITYNLAYIILPVSTSVYLALEASYTSRFLEVKLVEVEHLSEKNIIQEQEKHQILSKQKEVLEQQVQERTAALNQSLEELKATQALLVQQEKMASLGDLTAGIAHEIQNPLNFINNFSEINAELLEELKHDAQTGNTTMVMQVAAEMQENQEKILQHGNRADAIVKGMLQHSRASTGEWEPTDINALIDEYLHLSYHGMRAKVKGFTADLETNFDPNIGQINVVPQDLGRVLLNLFNNAFYALLEMKKRLNDIYKPEISVGTKHVGSYVEIQVQDNGIGIPQAALAKIFQPFFTTKPSGEGTGLGLSLSYDIVTKEHSGELTVQSIEGEGATFVIRLPI